MKIKTAAVFTHGSRGMDIYVNKLKLIQMMAFCNLDLWEYILVKM